MKIYIYINIMPVVGSFNHPHWQFPQTFDLFLWKLYKRILKASKESNKPGAGGGGVQGEQKEEDQNQQHSGPKGN